MLVSMPETTLRVRSERAARALFRLLFLGGLAGFGGAAQAGDRLQGRLEIGHLFSRTAGTQQGTAFSHLLSTLEFVKGSFAFQLDGRARLGLSPDQESRQDFSRLCLEYHQEDRFWVGAGRQSFVTLGGARVDGVFGGLSLGSKLRALTFAGLSPNPWTGALNKDFTTAGLGYVWSGKSSVHGGGLVFQAYQGEGDRLYLYHQTQVTLTSSLRLLALSLVDALSPRRFLGDLRETPVADQSGLERLNLTHGLVSLRYAPSAAWDLGLRAQHVFTILPNRWWKDWLEQERARRGFIMGSEDPIGTRRSSLELSGSRQIAGRLAAFATAEVERNHSHTDVGYGVRAGVSWSARHLPYLELSAGQSRRDVAEVTLLTARGEADFEDLLTLTWEASGMRSAPLDRKLEAVWLLDAGAGAGVSLASLSAHTRGATIWLFYQCLAEPGMTVHVGMGRLVVQLF